MMFGLKWVNPMIVGLQVMAVLLKKTSQHFESMGEKVTQLLCMKRNCKCVYAAIPEWLNKEKQHLARLQNNAYETFCIDIYLTGQKRLTITVRVAVQRTTKHQLSLICL